MHKGVHELYLRARKEGRALSISECETLLPKLVDSYPRTILIIDAMDECEKEDRQRLLDFLFDLAEKGAHPVKIFIASRPETDIHSHPSLKNLIVIDTADNKRDIEKYIEARLEQPGLGVSVSRDVKEQVKLTITVQSNGM